MITSPPWADTVRFVDMVGGDIFTFNEGGDGAGQFEDALLARACEWWSSFRRCAYRPASRNRRGALRRGCRCGPAGAADALLVAHDGGGGTAAFSDRVAEEATGTGVRVAVATTLFYL